MNFKKSNKKILSYIKDKNIFVEFGLPDDVATMAYGVIGALIDGFPKKTFGMILCENFCEDYKNDTKDDMTIKILERFYPGIEDPTKESPIITYKRLVKDETSLLYKV